MSAVRGIIGAILGPYRDYIGIMENEIQNTRIGAV